MILIHLSTQPCQERNIGDGTQSTAWSKAPYWMEDQAQASAWHAVARTSHSFCLELFMLRMPASAVNSVVASLVADLKNQFPFVAASKLYDQIKFLLTNVDRFKGFTS
jgi:hypothetical protein